MPPMAVLAGGLATRMRPLTETVPKSLLDVAGEPFIAHQLRLFRREGITRVVLCTGFLGEQIADFVGDGSAFGVEVSYSSDGDRLLGTGGALKRALPQLGDEFLVCYGDSYLDAGYRPIVDCFRRAAALALMTVYRNDDHGDVSNVVYADGRIVTYSKTARSPAMAHIDWGLGCFRRTVFDGWPETAPFDLAEVFCHLVDAGQLAAFEVTERFYEIGSPLGLAETDHYLRGVPEMELRR